MDYFSEILKTELNRRKNQNGAYSLRAFSKFLGISPASLSQTISGKRQLSTKKMTIILKKLGYSPKELIDIAMIDQEDKNQPSQKLELKDDEFKLISNWIYFAILSLGELQQVKADPRWVARRLNILPEEANEALSRLQKMGIIKIENGKFRQVMPPLKTTSDIPSAAIKNYHRGILDLAKNKLDVVDVKERDFSSLTMAINPKNLKKAKELTKNYKKDMMKLLERGTKERVYQLSIQLFPLDGNE